MRWLVAVPLLTGCELLFPLDKASAPTDAIAIDSSSDSPADVPMDAALACPPRFDIELNGSKYQFMIVAAATWTEAEAACEADAGTIAHLAVPDTRFELEFLKSQLEGVAWIGVARSSTAIGTERTSFREITGEVAALDLWRADEPSNGNGTEYAVAISDGLDFTDLEPDLNHMWICECDQQPPIAFDWQ